MTGNDWIQTASGRKFYPLRPRAADLHGPDIAHALAQLCRFTGHCHRFYSVAEHSVRVSRLAVTYLPDDATPEVRRMVARWGLFHDASEAYLCDIAAPIKRMPIFDAYRAAEKKLERAIAEWLGLPIDMPAEVKQADLVMLATEARALLGQPPEPWGLPYPPLPVSASVLAGGLGWDPIFAERMFLAEIVALSKPAAPKDVTP